VWGARDSNSILNVIGCCGSENNCIVVKPTNTGFIAVAGVFETKELAKEWVIKNAN